MCTTGESNNKYVFCINEHPINNDQLLFWVFDALEGEGEGDFDYLCSIIERKDSSLIRRYSSLDHRKHWNQFEQISKYDILPFNETISAITPQSDLRIREK